MQLVRFFLALSLVACIPPPPAQPSYFQGGQGGGYAPAQQPEPYAEQAPPPDEAPRSIMINGAAPNPRQMQVLVQLETASGLRLKDGRYWYDRVSGAFGFWGQPAGAAIGAGYDLGPALPANASNGTSGIFINGRQLRHDEVAFLNGLVKYQWQPGRYFIDAVGNAGLEGGPVIANLIAVAQQVHGKQPTAGGRNADGTVSYTIGSGLGQGQFFSDGNCRHWQDKKGNVISSGC